MLIEPGGPGRRLELGSVTLTALPLQPEDRDDQNNNSLCVRVDHGEVSALLPGDAEGPERRYWLDPASGARALVSDCEVLKLSHHGSANGTDEAWLRAVRPRVAVASLGAGNSYGHPHRETVELLKRQGIPLLRTDRDGTVVIVSDGRGIRVARGEAAVAAVAGIGMGAGAGEGAAGPGGEPGATVDLNRASRQELEVLPCIGPTLAARIIERRPSRSVEELVEVKGIGSKTVKRLRPQVRVGTRP